MATQQELETKAKELEEREKALEEREKALEAGPVPEEEREPTKAEKALIAEACKAYGIAEKYIFSSSVRNGVAVIVTHGGTRVRFAKGDEVEPLGYIQVSGVNPEWGKRKPVAGKKK